MNSLVKEILLNRTPGNTIAREARVWIKKYLIAASEWLGDNLIRSRGINLIKLISRPTQLASHEEEETANKVPRVIEEEKSIQ